MEEWTHQPCITALLRAPERELDLSGTRSFHLELVVTLHAPRPVLLYTANTFLSPSAALREGGIDFVREGESTPQPRSTIYLNRGGGTDRPWTPSDFLALEPETRTFINIPFGSQRSSVSSGDAHIDLRLLMTTSWLAAGETYKVALPSDVKVSWWRWETPGEVQQHKENKLKRLPAAGSAAWLWWWVKGKDDEGVPILPDEQQLPIHIVDSDVVLTSVGKRVEPVWRTSSSIMLDPRDG